MAFKVVMPSVAAQEDLGGLDRAVRQRVFDFFDRLESLPDPRGVGKALTGNFSGYWSYRMGDYRVIAKVVVETSHIVVVRVRHRKHVYG